MKIQHNLSSINICNLLGKTTKMELNIIEKLTSGYRINKAADDAAGLTISEKMRAQISGLNQATRNAQDGISLIQTAEGAINEVQDMVKRIYELSVQAANDTCNAQDRNSAQDEINNLIKEIDNTANNTEFNGIKLLDGSLKANTTSNSSNSMTLAQLLSSKSKNLNIIYSDSDNFETTKAGVGNATISGYTYLKNLLQKEIVPQAVTEILKCFSPAFNYLSSSSIGIGLELVNNPSSTTLAAVSAGCYSSGGNNVVSNMLTYELSVNMASLRYDTNGQLTNDSRVALETTIVHEMVHGFMDEALTNGMLGITNGVYDTRYSGTQASYEKSPNSYPNWFKEGMAQTAAGGYANFNDWVNGNGNNSGNGGLGITTSTSQTDISTIVKESNNYLASGSTASKYGTGYLACMYLGYLASGGSSVTAGSISSGLGLVLSDLASGKNLETVIKDRTNGKYTSVSDFESKFGDADSSSFIYRLTQIVGNSGNGGLVSGSLTDSDLLPNVPATTSLFSLDTTNDTVQNIYPSGVNVLSGGGEVSSGTGPVPDYSSTITGGNNDPTPVNPGSTIDLANIAAIDGVSYDSTNNVLTITKSGDYTLTGINTRGTRVVVNDGVNANVTLNNASINTSTGSGISLEGSANITLNLVGSNKVITSKTEAAGIRVTTGATLTIQGKGTLDVENACIMNYPMQNDDTGAGIGGASGEDGGSITINGGTIIAKSKTMGAGIGGGSHGKGGNITIAGGDVTAIEGDDGYPSGWCDGAAGIGGGGHGDGGTITITGGTVNALSKHFGAGIGGGNYGQGGIITITGGNITAHGEGYGAGIGGGGEGNGGIIKITGGNITAKSEIYGAGIGGGDNGDGGTITITGGNITAEGSSSDPGYSGAGIGGGLWAGAGNVNINGKGVIIKAKGACGVGGGSSVYKGQLVAGGTVTKTTGIIFEGSNGGVYGDVTLSGPLDCEGKNLTVQGGSTLTVLNGGTIINHGTLTNHGSIENYGIIGSVSGPGITHHYVTGIIKNIKEPTTATIGETLAQSISEFSPSSITVSYNGTTRQLTGTWSVSDKDGNPITDLSTIIKDKESYTYTIDFASEDGIYFDPLNMSIYQMQQANSKYEVVSDPYISKSGPQGGNRKLSYSYLVASAPAGASPQPQPNPAQQPVNQVGGIKIQIGANANETMDIMIESIKTKDLGIDNLSVLTHLDAQSTMTESIKAIDKTSQMRANLGAYQNRLEHSIANLSNSEENLQVAESRIRDMDIAKGMMEYSKNQILIQVAHGMLAQTNQSTNKVLSLLS